MNTQQFMLSDKRKFTVVIPTHQRPLLLRRALRSLAAQTYQNFNVVIVDDSPAYIPPYEELMTLGGRYTYIIRSGAPGPSESRNMGASVANSEYVIFLDDDDTFESGHLASLADSISDRSPELVFTSFKVCYENREQNPPAILDVQAMSIADVDKDSVFVRNRIPNSCLAYRYDVVESVWHNASMRIYEDWDFLLACLNNRDLTYVDIDSVVIHKTPNTSPENIRRGNSRHDLTVEVMLDLYKKFPGYSMEIKLARQSLLASAGIPIDLASC